MPNPIPIPIGDAIATPPVNKRGDREPRAGQVTQPWVDWFTSIGDQVSAAPEEASTVRLASQSASIGATDMSDGNLPAGLYRFSWYARITQAAGVSSSLTVTVDWTDGGVACAFSGAAMVGNVVTEIQSETKMIEIDNATPVRYSTVYASAGAPVMLYKLVILLESLPV